MKKKKFLRLLQNSHSIKDDDLKKIIGLESMFPYSQVLHTLTAIGTRNLKSADSNKKLTDAAVYSTDRLVLKKLIQSIDETAVDIEKKSISKKDKKIKITKTIPSPESIPENKTKKVKEQPDKDLKDKITKQPAITKIPIKTPAESVLKPSSPIVHQATDHPGLLSEKKADQLRAELMKNLEDLIEIKKLFFGVKTDPEKKTPESKSSLKSNVADTPAMKPTSKAEDGTKKMSVTKPLKKSTIATKKVVSKSQKPQKTGTTKKNTQQDIIDKFIKSEPKITRKKDATSKENQNDLSIDSVSFNDDLISENLAKVMVKQGKTSKAIDIYKKLIWKFPQKKAYFASQIESLKEK